MKALLSSAEAALERLAESGPGSKIFSMYLNASGRRNNIPLSPELNAYNVFEFDVDAALLQEVRRLYDATIGPNLSKCNEGFEADGYHFWVRSAWSDHGNLKWWAVDSPDTYQTFLRFFERLGLAERFEKPGLVDVSKGLRVYNAFFVTRSYFHGSAFHVEYVERCKTNAYTVMIPLGAYSSLESGQLLYYDANSRRQVYRYTKGKGAAFGSHFLHSTQPLSDKEPRAFLCFTFGTDKNIHWPDIARAVTDQCRLLYRADGRLEMGTADSVRFRD